MLMDLVHVQFVGKSQLLSINVETSDAKLSADIANALATGFIESQLDANLDMSLATTNWMNSRLDELRENSRAPRTRYRPIARRKAWWMSTGLPPSAPTSFP